MEVYSSYHYISKLHVVNWQERAYTFCFFDQNHFIKEFKKLLWLYAFSMASASITGYLSSSHLPFRGQH